MQGDYEAGMVPNVDVLFTRHILFGYLLETAVHQMAADMVVTGHYARTSTGEHVGSLSQYEGEQSKCIITVYSGQM